MFYKVLFAVLALCCVADAQVFFTGSCPADLPTQPGFKVADYLGKWYEQTKYPTIYEPNGKCNTAEYSLNESNVTVLNTLIDLNTNVLDNIVGSAAVVSGAKLLVEFETPVGVALSNYWVLGTDYKTYSVVYSCRDGTQDGKKGHFVTVWILTRERMPQISVLANALAVVNRNHLSLKSFVNTQQYDCTN